MSSPVQEGTLRAQSLMGRRVWNHQERKLGRVYDLEAERVDDELCVTALLVGPRSWLTRFGWAMGEHGTRVPWEQIESFDPVIRLRAGGADADR